MIWDVLLNENYKRLRNDLDETQIAGLRDMQRAWIQGTMAIPLGAACVARETARRALLLKFFDGL